jgi:anti-anti-sigma regulatory factor
MDQTIKLPRELNIYRVAELREQWLKALNASTCALADESDETKVSAFAVDAADVDETDGAGIQLLLSLARTLEQQRRQLQLVNASEPMRKACETLGVSTRLIPVREEIQAS